MASKDGWILATWGRSCRLNRWNNHFTIFRNRCRRLHLDTSATPFTCHGDPTDLATMRVGLGSSGRLKTTNVILVLTGGFLICWYPTTIGFPTKNEHFGCLGVPPFKETPTCYGVGGGASQHIILTNSFSIKAIFKKSLTLLTNLATHVHVLKGLKQTVFGEKSFQTYTKWQMHTSQKKLLSSWDLKRTLSIPLPGKRGLLDLIRGLLRVLTP